MTSGGIRIEPMTAADAAEVIEIYRFGIATGNATFETEPPTWSRFDATRLPFQRFVARAAGGPGSGRDGGSGSGRVLGWVACSATSDRSVYAGVVEHSVYVHPEAGGRGIGRALLTALIDATEAAGIWTIQSHVFPENTASVRVHQAVGFRVVGRRERLGRHYDSWRDVLLIERRSPSVT